MNVFVSRVVHFNMRRAQRLGAWLLLATMLAGVLAAVAPAFDAPSASAHNLQTTMVYMFFDPNTQKMLDNRIAGGGYLPPAPLLKVGDELGIIIKVLPMYGTTTGVGGHVDFYIPNGVQVLDAAYLMSGDLDPTDGISGYDKVPMKGQAQIAVGAGPIGANGTSQLIGLTGSYTNILGIAESPVVTTTGLHRGTIAGVYGDTGIFYSTDPDTAFGSWQTLTGNASEKANCGLVGTFPLGNAKSLTNNSGDVIVPCNAWDAGQLYAWGVKGTTFTGVGAASAPIVDYGDGRGNAPWGFASGVAGPQSGYAWYFNWNQWKASAKDAAAMRAAMAPSMVGPWNRLQYPGSRISKDQPGSLSVALGTASVDGSKVGATFPLPNTVSQTDSTSPKAIRWAVGQLTNMVPEYVWVKIKVNDPTQIVNIQGCPVFDGDTFGGDAGGYDNGKDHLWRYYEPSHVTWNACTTIAKPASTSTVQVGQTFNYNLSFYNTSFITLTNVIITDTLPSGVSYVSAVPAQNSGPNPLVWKLGSLRPGDKFAGTLTVNATGAGALTNVICMSSGQFPAPTCTQEVVSSGSIPILRQGKSVTPSTAAPGDNVQYTIRIDNTGSGPSGSPIRIEDTLDPALTYVSLNKVLLNNADVTSLTTVNATNPGLPVFTVPGGVNAGSALLLTFTAKVASTAAPGDYCNTYVSYAPSTPNPTGSLACVSVNGGQIGDTVYRDWNGNGVQDTAEEGLSSVVMQLTRSNGVTSTVTTNSSGGYLFSGLPAGTYTVTVLSGVPISHTLTGDPDGTKDGRTVVNLTTNQKYLSADFGYQPRGTGSIGDIVFDDRNADGIYNAGDVVISGVTVLLYEDANGNGVVDPSADALISTTTTVSPAGYLFSNLATGFNYIAKVNPSDTALATYFSNAAFQATTNTAIPVANLSGAYLDADFGFYKPVPGSIGDQVYADNNGNQIYDSGDAPLANVAVTLYRDVNGNGVIDGSDILLAATTTSITGTYLFADRPAGSYLVHVDDSDPDIPAGYVAATNDTAATLTTGQQRTDVDFPFVRLLSKQVSKTTANAGDTLVYTLTVAYPGSDLMSNLKLRDPLPAGVSYVSANQGGSYGVYTSSGSSPGYDDDGTNFYTTTLAVTPTTVAVGATVTVTMRLTSTPALTVTPTSLDVSGGSATCSAATPASATLTANVGKTFTYTCVIGSVGEFFFSGGADADNGYSFPDGTSNGVLATTTGATTRVVWDIGTAQADIPGQSTTSGSLASLYGMQGNGQKVFAQYTIASDSWKSQASLLGNVKQGGALATSGTNIYALAGNNTKSFYSYLPGTNTWSGTPTDPSVAIGEGGALVYYPVSNTLYALAGCSGAGCAGTTFMVYDIGLNLWTTKANTPATVKKGGALTTDGTNIYALAGNGTTAFWRYNVSSNTWTTLASIPTGVAWGGSLARVGSYIYAMSGNNTNKFYRYNIAANTWTAMTATPGNVQDGGALATDGVYIYALQGKTTALWRYSIAGNAWTKMATFPATVGQGGALVYLPSNATGARLTNMHAAPTLVNSGSHVSVTMYLAAEDTITNVVPSSPLTVTDIVTKGGSASCGSPSPASLTIVSGTVSSFTWDCVVTSTAAGPSSLTFAATATGFGSKLMPRATSNSVFVVRPFTFSVTVSNTVPVVDNTGLLIESDGVLPAAPSNTTHTAIGASFGDFVWADLNANGLQDVGEPGIGGVTVTVTSAAGAKATATTGIDGSYAVYSLTSGTYTATYALPSALAAYLPTTPIVHSATITSTQQYKAADFGLRPPAAGAIGDTVWVDANANGIQDANEPGLPGVTVTLAISGATSWLTLGVTTTDASGVYSFTGLRAGTYRVTVDQNSVVTSPYDSATTSTLGAAMQLVSSGGLTTTLSNPLTVTLASDSTKLATVDFGYNWKGSIGDFVWYDTNGDGQQGGGEVGAPNGTVALYVDVDKNGAVSPGDYIIRVAITCNNTPTFPCVNGQGPNPGQYLFSGLPPGWYVAKISVQEIPSSTSGKTNSLVTSTPEEAPVNLAAGQAYLDADFGVTERARISGHVYHDVNNNGVLDEGPSYLLPSVTVTLTGVDVNNNPVVMVTTTNASGAYLFLVSAGTYTITYSQADVTAQDPSLTVPTSPLALSLTALAGVEYSDYDFGVNNNGRIGDTVFIDVNGNGVQDVGEAGLSNVTLNLFRSGAFLRTTASNALGWYNFTGLMTGTYTVTVVTATLPLSYTQTADPDQSGTCTLCDNTGTATVTAQAPDQLGIDFGYQPQTTPYTVSGVIFEDLNGSGIYTPGAQVFTSTQVTVIYTDTNNSVIRVVATTDSSGFYTVTGIPAGSNVAIRVLASTLPSPAYTPTVPAPPLRIINAINTNQTGQNFGYRRLPADISGYVCDGNYTGLCSISGVSDTALSGITVTLRFAGPDGILNTSDDSLVTSTTTITGYYFFTGLEPGLYQVTELNAPGYFSLSDKDSPNGLGNPDNISVIGLAVGETRVRQDFLDTATPDLGVTKIGVPAVVDSGGQLTYTLVVTNALITATNVVVTDTLPAAVTFVTGTTAYTLTAQNGVIIWQLGSIPADVTRTLTMAVTISPTLSGLITNTVTVAGKELDLNPDNNTYRAQNKVELVADLILRKWSEPKPHLAGQVITYTVVVTNAGPSRVNFITVTDSLPDGLTGVRYRANTGVYTPSTGAWSGIALVAGGQVTLTITGTVALTQVGTLTNTAVVTTNVARDPTPDNNSGLDVNPQAKLLLTKVGIVDSTVVSETTIPDEGDIISYTLTATNTGEVTLTNVIITDTRLSSLNCAPGQPTALAPGAVLTCMGIYTLTAADIYPRGYVTNTATADSDQTPPVKVDNIVWIAGLAIAKQGDPPTVTLGGNITYTLFVTNTGTVTLTAVTLTDSKLNQTWSIGTMLAGAVTKVTAVGPVVLWTDLPGPIVNTAIVTGITPWQSQIGPITGTITTPVSFSGGLAIVKLGTPLTATIGGTVNYAVVVTNTGDITLTNVTIRDGKLGLTQTIPSLAAGAVTSITGSYGPVSAADLPGPIVNTAVVTATTPTGYPIGPFTGTITTPVVYTPGLAILKTGTPQSAVVGQVITYTIRVTNTGNVALTNVTVSDAKLGLTQQIASLAAGAATDVTGYYGPVSVGDLPGPIVNSASATGTGPLGEPVGPVTSTYSISVSQPLTAWLTGIVTDIITGLPIPGATVVVTDSAGVTYTLTTDGGGAYTVTQLATGPASVTASKPEYSPAGATLTIVTGANRQDLGLLLRSLNITATSVCIKDAPYLRYSVTPVNFTPGSNPVTVRWIDSVNSSVLYTYTNQPLSQDMLWPEAGVDSNGVGNQWPGWSVVNGQWVYNGSSLRPQVKVEFKVNPQQAVTVTYPAPSPTCVSDPTASLTGVVTDTSTGLLIPGATVVVTDSQGITRTIITDASGAYSVTRVAIGPAVVTATKPGYTPDAASLTLVYGLNRQDLRLTPVAPVVLVGVVTDTLTGLPIPGATVIVTDSSGVVYTLTTDAVGGYLVDGLAVGPAVVTASKPHYTTDTQSVTIVTGVNQRDLGLTPHMLIGVITDITTGLPIPGATVVVTDSGGVTYTVVADGDGVYSVAHLALGPAQVTASKPGYSTESAQLTIALGVNRQDLALLPNILTGVVLDVVTGLPIPGATVVVVDSLGNVYTVTADATGAYTVTAIPVGHTVVTAFKAGYATVYTTTDIQPGANIKDVPLPAAALSGTVTDAKTGQPISDTVIVVVDAANVTYTMVTGSDGKYRVPTLAVDQANVTAAKTGYHSKSAQKLILRGENVQDFVLEKLSPTDLPDGDEPQMAARRLYMPVIAVNAAMTSSSIAGPPAAPPTEPPPNSQGIDLSLHVYLPTIQANQEK